MHLDFKLVHAHLAVISFRLSERLEQAVGFEIASVWIHIIYQADTFRQTHRNTEASFTCPLGHKLLFLLAQHQNLLAQAIAPGCFPGLLSEGFQVNILWSIDLLFNNGNYYSFKIFCCFCMTGSLLPWQILHNQQALAIFGRCEQYTINLMVYR